MSDASWGEIPPVADTASGIAALEREQITKPRPMDIEGPALHQPSSRHRPPTNEALPPEHFQIDPVVIHTIRLIQHIKKLRTAIAALQQDIKQEDASVTVVGAMPEYDGPPLRDRSEQKYFAEEEYQSDFVQGKAKPPPPIDELTCRKLLRRSTAAICAHLSFDASQDTVLETLTDICHEFLAQFTRHLGAAADRRATYGAGGFPDVIERVFHEMGIGSVSTLHDFYQQRVLAYHKKMERQCQLLMNEYSTLSKQAPVAGKSGPQSPGSSDTLHVIRIKEEPSADIQFPLLDDNDEVNETEQLLNIESLGSFEITVEHETSAGLTTEVETKWSHSKTADGRSKQTASTSSAALASSTSSSTASASASAANVEESAIQNPGSVHESIRTPHSNVPRTPQSNIAQTPQDLQAQTPNSQEDNNIPEPGSISSMDIFAPSVPTPSNPKKKKKS